MNKVFRFVIAQKIYVFVIVLGLSMWSAFTLNKLQIDAVPDISSTQVMVNTKTAALSTEQIEKIVTYPIEMELSGLQNIRELRSLSKYGLSQVIAVFEDGTDLYFARQLVTERLQNAKSQIPDGLSPELAPVSTGLGEIFMWSLALKPNSEKLKLPHKEQLQYLKRVQDYVIRPKMKQVPGVAEIDTNGGFSSEVHINFTPDRLKEFGLSTNDILRVTSSLGVAFSGGYIQKEGQHITIAANTDTKSLEDIRNFVIKIFPNGKVLKLGDVCRVEIDSSLRVGAATADGSETVLGTVLMRIGENSRQVAADAKAVFSQLSLPEDVVGKIIYNREFLVNATIHTVEKNLLEGAGLVILVLFLILGNFRAAALVSLAIPISMLMALKGMGLLKISANLMSLGAIDFGLLVDASVVIVENYLRRSKELSPKPSMKEKIELLIASCTEVAPPVILGLLIIMLVYIPLLSLEGIEGKMFAPMAITVLMALGASLVVAIVVMPLLILYGIPTHTEHKETRVFQWISKSYERLLHKALEYKKAVLAGAISLFLIAAVIFSNLGSDFVPQLDEGDMIIGLVRDSRQNIEESVQQQLKAEEIIKKFQEVELVFSRLGTPESATDPMSPNFADTFLILKKKASDWPLIDGRRRTKDELFEAIKKELAAQLPEHEASATQPIEMRFNEILEGSRADITLRILGPNLETLLDYAQKAEKILEKIPGVQSLEFDALTGLTKTPVIDLTLNSKSATEYDLSTQDIAQQLELSLAGRTVGHYFLEDKRIPIVFHLDEALRDDLTVLEQLPIPLPNGGTVPLSKFASLERTEKVTTIARRWSQRYSAISISLADRDIESFVNEARAAISASLKLESGYTLEWGGQFENLERARNKLMWLVPSILLAIFFLIFKVTASWKQTAIIFSAIPLGLAGGVYALFLRNIHFSVSAAVGFIALSGIVVLNSVVLVSFINQMKASGLDTLTAVQSGAVSRLRPIVMTALVASLGFLPMAFGSGLGSEVQRPLATVVIGGILTSTLLTLFVVPILLAWNETRAKKTPDSRQ